MSRSGALRLLVMCTGDLDRSPTVKTFFHAEMDKRGLAVRSCSARSGSTDPISSGNPVDRANQSSGATHRSRRLRSQGNVAAHLIIGVIRGVVWGWSCSFLVHGIGHSL